MPEVGKQKIRYGIALANPQFRNDRQRPPWVATRQTRSPFPTPWFASCLCLSSAESTEANSDSNMSPARKCKARTCGAILQVVRWLRLHRGVLAHAWPEHREYAEAPRPAADLPANLAARY